MLLLPQFVVFVPHLIHVETFQENLRFEVTQQFLMYLLLFLKFHSRRGSAIASKTLKRGLSDS
jgi:hypothetical protein